MERENPARHSDTGLICLMILARLHGLPADAGQLRHQFGQSGQDFASNEILLAAKSLGLNAREIASDWVRLHKTPLPAIGSDKDGRFFVIGKISEDKILMLDPGEQTPDPINRASAPSGAS